MSYPDIADGWIFRSDVSNTAMLRWEYNDTLAIVTRHASCENAVVPRQRNCRNCEMKRTWRKQCSEKCDTLFLVALDDSLNVEEALSAVVKQERQLSDFVITRLLACVPSNASVRRALNADYDASSIRAFELEQKFRLRLIKSRQAVVQNCTTADLLIDLAYPRLNPSPPQLPEQSPTSSVVDDFDKLVNVTNTPPVAVVTPSRELVIVTPRRDPTSPVVLATTVATTDLSTVTEAYSSLIDQLSPGQLCWTLNEWHAIADGHNFSSPFIRLNQCAAFDRLVRKMGCRASWTQIILHPTMHAFMQTMRGVIRQNGSVTVGVGVYRAPNVDAYDAFCSLELTGSILVNPVYVAATVDPPGVRPVVVLYQPPAGLVGVTRVVPIGAFGL